MLFPSSTKRERWVVAHLFVNDELNSYICFSKFSLESLDLMDSSGFFFKFQQLLPLRLYILVENCVALIQSNSQRE